MMTQKTRNKMTSNPEKQKSIEEIKALPAASLDDVLGMPLGEDVVDFEGKKYRVIELNEAQAVKYELELQDKKGNFDVTKMRRTMIAYSWVDADGNRIVDDSNKLKTMRRSLAGYLYEACQKLNRYEPGELEDLVKNSEATESSD